MEQPKAGPSLPEAALTGGMRPLPDGRRHPVWLCLALACSLAGLVISGHLTFRHLGGTGRLTALLTPLCGAESAACDQVLASRWGKIALGRVSTPDGPREFAVPTAMLGLLYFCAVLVWYLFVGRPNHTGRFWHLVPGLAVLCGLGFSAWLVYAMFAELPEPCPLCLVAHAANGGLGLGTLMLRPRKPHAAVSATRPPAAPSPRLAVTGIVLSATAAMLVARTLAYDNVLRARVSERARLAGYLQDADLMAYLWRRQTPRQIPIGPDDPVRGPADAAHTAVVFSDFLCPHCRNLFRMLEEQVRGLPGVTLRVVYKYHPLNRGCNPNAKSTVYALACEASCAAEAVRRRQGNDAFWQAHDLLFEAGNRLSAGGLRSIAERVGLPPAEFEQAIADPAVRARIRETTAQAKELGISATPTVFLDGRTVEAWHRIETWEQIFKTPG